MTFITHEFRVSVVSLRTREGRGYETSGTHLRFMLRRSSLVECVTRNVFTKRRNFFYSTVSCSHVCQVHILYHKELADARILQIVDKSIRTLLIFLIYFI